MKELESDVAQKNSRISDLEQLLQEASEKELAALHVIGDLREQVSSVLVSMEAPAGL